MPCHTRARVAGGLLVALLLPLLAALPTAAPAAAEDASAAPGDGWRVVHRTVVPRTNTVTVALLAPLGSRPDFTAGQAAAAVADVAAYYRRETGGALTVKLDKVLGWTPVTGIACTWQSALLDWAQTRHRWSRGTGRHLTVMVPENGGCPSDASGEQNASVASGGRTFQPTADPNFLVHELGHNMSLRHASSVACRTTWDFSTVGRGLPSGCTRDEYGNLLDMMGGSWTLDDAITSPELDRLGMLPRRYEPVCGAERRLEVTAPEAGAAGRRAVSWTDPRDPGVRYWADFRGAASVGAPGVQLLRNDPVDPLATTVLQRPGDGSPRRQLLAVGERVTLGGGVQVSLLDVAADRRSGTLAVTVPCPVAAAAAAAVTTTASNPGRVRQGATASVTVRVVAPGQGTASGAVSISDGDRVLSRGTLSGGTVRLSVPTSGLGTGSHALGVSFAGGAGLGTGRTSTTLVVEPAVTRSAVRVTAPSRNGRGAQAAVTVARDPAGALPRTVRLTVLRGDRRVVVRDVALQRGAARWALPRLKGTGHRVVVSVPATSTSLAATASAAVPGRY